MYHIKELCMHAQLLSHVQLWDPMDCSLPGSSVHGISQARILEWIAMSFSKGSSWSRDRTSISCIAGKLFTTESPGKPKGTVDNAKLSFALNISKDPISR